MSIDSRDERNARRIEELFATDPEFAGARPRAAVGTLVNRPALGLSEVVSAVLEGYSDRPALAQRAVELVEDPVTKRKSLELLPCFDTITYRELADRVRAITNAWHNDPLRPGDRVAILGFTSVDYTTIDTALTQLGAVAVPLQTGAPVAQLRPIVAETAPTLIASSIGHVAEVVELVLAGHQPARVVVFDFHREVDDQREALEAASGRLADAGRHVIVETLSDVLERGETAVDAAPIVPDQDDPLALLIYTSGSTGTPKGAMYPASKVADMWRVPFWAFDQQSSQLPSITLNFMPMSHFMGRSVLYGSLSTGGIAYFGAQSDLSTILEDLALVRPTQLNFPPRIWDMLLQEYQRNVDRRAVGGADRAIVEAEVMTEMRQELLGGRFVTAITGSAPTSPGSTNSWTGSSTPATR
jgi:fatty acid CoA ligase FadD9